MAITFNKLKTSKLNLLDTFTFGKYQSCRVCDVLPESYEYVLWLHEKNPHMFTKEVVDSALILRREAVAERNQREEIDPYLAPANPWFSDWNDDIPF
jgi:uncharacterized protein (DUF3820 family)